MEQFLFGIPPTSQCTAGTLCDPHTHRCTRNKGKVSLRVFRDLPLAAEASGHRQPLVWIGMIYFNGSVATRHWYRSVPMTTSVGHRWEKSERTHYYCFVYAARGIYICSRLFRILAHAKLFGIFHLFTWFLDKFDYTATCRVHHAQVAVEWKKYWTIFDYVC